MRIEKTKIEGSEEVGCNLIFEEEDDKLYDDFAEMAKIKNKTVQELVDEVFTIDNLLKFCFGGEKKLINDWKKCKPLVENKK